jgi:ketosteroid isomerase-like protein
MAGEPQTALQRERETEFLQSVGAFVRRDFATLEATWRPDVVLEVPGASWLAGIHKGFENASRCVVGLRQVLGSDEKRTTFLHDGDQMIVRHDITVHSPMHAVEMTLRVRVAYDRDGKTRSIHVEPEDRGLFDHVVNTVLRNQSSA